MNVVFSAILIATLTALIIFSPESALTVMMDGVEASAQFALKLFVIYGVWLSVMKIWERCSLDKAIAKGLNPLTKRLFPKENEETYKYLNLNISANLLGMGGAATPMGIKASENIINDKNRIMLTVINSTSIQLIPATVLAMRAEVGATTDIIIPSLICSVITTAVGMILVKILVR